MKRVEIDYDEVTGQMFDASGGLIASWMNLVGYEANEGVSVETLIKLKNAGYTAEEIITLKFKEII